MAGHATLKTVGPWVAVKQDEETTVVNDTQTGETLLATSYTEDHNAAVLAAMAPELRDVLKDIRAAVNEDGEAEVDVDAIDTLLRRCEGFGA